jgi:xylulokinase
MARSESVYSTYSPGPDMTEINADVFWKAVVEVTRNVSELMADDPIEAISISSHGETVIPVNRHGEAIGPAIMNSDNRAVKETNWWNRELGRDEIYRITGLPLHAMFALNKIIWLRENQPDVFTKADRFVSVEDYILLRMGLPPYTDFSLASRTMAFDIHKKKWSEELLKCAGIHEDKLGILLPSGEKAGKLSLTVASELGLKVGTIVAMGGHDQPCGALGSGVINEGEVYDSAGTYECMVAVSKDPCNSEKALSYSLNSYCHVVPDRYVTLAFFPAGLVSRWYIEQFCYEDKVKAQEQNMKFFEFLDATMEKSCHGPTGLCITPHLVGSCNPYWDVRATGVIAGLTPQITRHHVYKAIYEGIACELAINATALKEVIGEFESIKINGGNARSHFTVQLRADLTGKRFYTLKTSEAVCQGAAILAGIAAGIYKDAEDAVQKVVRTDMLYKPNMDSKEQYKGQMEKYKLLYPSLKSIRAV